MVKLDAETFEMQLRTDDGAGWSRRLAQAMRKVSVDHEISRVRRLWDLRDFRRFVAFRIKRKQ
jgi:hypothetical protein